MKVLFMFNDLFADSYVYPFTEDDTYYTYSLIRHRFAFGKHWDMYDWYDTKY